MLTDDSDTIWNNGRPCEVEHLAFAAGEHDGFKHAHRLARVIDEVAKRVRATA